MKFKSRLVWVLFFSLVFFINSGFTVVGHRGDPIKYPEETIEAIKRETQRITPVTIRETLENCERLPQEYIEFGSKMHKYRYDFARELVERNKKYIKEESQKREIKSIIDEER